MRGSARQALWLLVVGGVLATVVFTGMILGWWGLGEDALGDALTSLLPAVSFIGLGALILWRSDAQRIGWLLGAMGLSVMAAGVAGGLSEFGYLAGQAIGGAFWLSWILAIGLLIAWFPTGRVVSPAWRWLEWLLFGTIGLTFFVYTFTDELCVDFSDDLGCLEWAPNPIGIPGLPNPEFGSMSGPLFAIAGVMFLLAVVSLIVRVIRARGVERQQLKWFLLAGGILVLGFLLETVMDGFGIVATPTWVDGIVTVGLVTLPISVILAILRYRLYDIDRIISRTVTYGVVVGLLAGVVALVAAIIGTRFQSPLVVAATTLGVAAVFNPLRRRVQRLVDRRFNRSRYDVERVMDDFARSLREGIHESALLEGWQGVVSETMHPSSVSVWVRGQ